MHIFSQYLPVSPLKQFNEIPFALINDDTCDSKTLEVTFNSGVV